jgi:hypothetical protein
VSRLVRRPAPLRRSGGGTVTDAEVQGDQPVPGYRDILLDPTETYMCLRCGALIKQDPTDLHDRST